MIRFDQAYRTLAVGIAILAGFVDAIGFVESAGFFVSFMTGNSTRLAVGVAEGHRAALLAGSIIAIFVTGVVAGSLIGARAGRRRTPVAVSYTHLDVYKRQALERRGVETIYAGSRRATLARSPAVTSLSLIHI